MRSEYLNGAEGILINSQDISKFLLLVLQSGRTWTVEGEYFRTKYGRIF
jgi:hypothetical protein